MPNILLVLPRATFNSNPLLALGCATLDQAFNAGSPFHLGEDENLCVLSWDTSWCGLLSLRHFDTLCKLVRKEKEFRFVK